MLIELSLLLYFPATLGLFIVATLIPAKDYKALLEVSLYLALWFLLVKPV